MFNLNKAILSLSITAMVTLIGCGSSSSSDSSGAAGETGGDDSTGLTSITALSLPSNIDVIKASDSSTPNTSKSRSISNKDYSTLEDNDYNNDITNFYVQDDSTQALSTVNEIMGFIKDTNYANYVNQGPYIAMIKEKEEQKGNQNTASSGGNQSSDDIEVLQEFWINVTRENNTSDMIIDGWVDFKEDTSSQEIQFKIVVTKGIDSEYPAGEFTMYIKGEVQGINTMKNILKISKGVSDPALPVVVQYKEEANRDNTYFSEVNLMSNTDFSIGKAYTKSTCWDNTAHTDTTCEYKIAYNSDYAKVSLVSKGGVAETNTTGTILDKNNFKYKIYNYGLYEKETGNRPELNAGKHLLINDGSKTYHGYAGYWGVWAGDDGIDLSTATITDDDNNSYKVFTAPGKLTKHETNEIALEDLDSVEMNMWTNDGEKIIKWNGQAQKFYITATQTWEGNSPIQTQITPVELNTSNVNEYDGAWCNSLQAHFNIGRLYIANQATQTAPTNATTLKYFKSTNVAPSDLSDSITLTSYDTRQFTGMVTTTNTSTIVKEVNWSNYSNLTINDFKGEYKFNNTDMTLYAGNSTSDDSKKITLADDVNESHLTQTNFSWGIYVDTLLDDASLASITSDLNGSITLDNWWKIRNNVDKYYSWQSGYNEWDQYKLLQDISDDTFVKFDQPWEISYTHSTSNDRNDLNTSDGKTFRLHFDGNNLNLPWSYNEELDTWVPEFSIEDGTQITYDSVNYVSKALDGEQLLNKVTSAEVALANGTEPDLSSVDLSETGIDLSEVDSISFASKPTAELKVKVIKGINQ